MRRPWTETELAVLRANYRKMPARDLATILHRTKRSIYEAAVVHGLSVAGIRRGISLDRDIRRLHAEGWSDTEIAAALATERHFVSAVRRRLGLALNGNQSERYRRRVRAKTAEQLAAAGVASLAELRVVAFRKFAREHGWPDDLRPRHVQILDLLLREGPKTRIQIAAAIGMPWIGSRASLHSNDPEGSYLAHLIRRGLVVSLGRLHRGSGSGHSTEVYSLTLEGEQLHGQLNHNRRTPTPPPADVDQAAAGERRRRLDEHAAPGPV